MTDLPYTYTDVDGDYLRIGKGAYTAYDPSSRKAVSVTTPTGEDAVRLAHAVLAAAGHTGHIVVSTEDSARAIRIRESVAAEDMRERAARVPAVIASSDPLAMRTVFEQIFALPLLDGDPDDQAPSLESRVEALEQQYTDIADLTHGHSEDLARLRRRFTAQDDG